MKTFFSFFWTLCAIILFWFLLDCFYGYFYPIKFVDEIKTYSQKFEISPALVASVINVESGYNPERISQKGAVGLMQIMPKTGGWIAEKMGDEFEEEILMQPDKNIEYGAFYLSYLLNYFGDLRLCLCAYNAGIGNVKSWLSSEEYSSNGNLEKIPFPETEIYVAKVKKNLSYYSRQNTYYTV